MTISVWLAMASQRLKIAQIDTARLDALVLLEGIVGRDRTWLLAHPEYELSAAQTFELKKLLKRRADHEPLAYIRGRVEFYGREFVLTSAVLQPRPESETMIELSKTLPIFTKPADGTRQKTPKKPAPIHIADVGTGSGVLGITAALELPHAVVDLLDIDPQALKIAKMNVDKFTPSLRVIESDLLSGTRQDYDILLCNLPYVPDDFEINSAAGKEPRTAIFGGSDGLDIYRRLFKQIQALTQKPLYILTEALPPQHQQLTSVARSGGYKLQQVDDFAQVFVKF